MDSGTTPKKTANKRPTASKAKLGEKKANAPRTRKKSDKLSNYEASLRLVDQLQKTDRLDELDVAHVSALLNLAAACDTLPESAGLWAQYRQALTELYERVNNGDDDFNDLMARLSAASSHPTNRAAD
jgi:ABC-type transporter Mla subunit MlaD